MSRMELNCVAWTCLASHKVWNKSVHRCTDARSLLWKLIVRNKFGMSFNKPTSCGSTQHFIRIDRKKRPHNERRSFRLPIQRLHRMKVRVIQAMIKKKILKVSTITPSLKESGRQKSELKPTCWRQFEAEWRFNKNSTKKTPTTTTTTNKQKTHKKKQQKTNPKQTNKTTNPPPPSPHSICAF